MTKFRFTLQAAALVVFTLAFTSFAQAQATRTWVSGVGDDVNPCSRTAPCKTWAGAISKTAAGGEIDALDPGGFGTLTITKSITIDGTTGQGWGSTLNSGGINGFVINDSLSGTPNTAVVTLRNLSINGAGTTKGLNGIRFIAGKSVVVENVTIENQTGAGISVAMTVSLSTLHATNVTIRGCTTAISMSTTSGVVIGSFNDIRSYDNPTGYSGGAGNRSTVRDSVFSGSSTNAAISANTSEVTLINNGFLHNPGTAVNVSAGGTVRLTDNVIVGNGTGINNGGTAQSFNNNKVIGNTNDVLGGAITNVSATNTR